ncbi:MAG: NAD(P)-dependent dehydrogenase (short-subunit alcohol dehydrogenase family) [Saprospiraceae bacterium]|jgi:NAD(P)-dependent dehydrogenase (short-subunit alcohol dehydrogenase family)
MTNQLDGKKCLVTGGRQSIGRAIVDRFVGEGAQVVTCGRSVRPADLPSEVDWLQTDVSSTDDVKALKQWIGEKWGCLDGMVNNVGVQIEKSLINTTDND